MKTQNLKIDKNGSAITAGDPNEIITIDISGEGDTITFPRSKLQDGTVKIQNGEIQINSPAFVAEVKRQLGQA